MKNKLPDPDELTLKGYRKLVDQWIKTYGVRYFHEMTNLAVLMEEVGELARLMARIYGDQSFKKKEKKKSLADEMADVFFVLVCLANQMNIPLEKALLDNLKKKTQRDKHRHKKNKKLISG